MIAVVKLNRTRRRRTGREALQAYVIEHGSQKAAADALQISYPYLNDLIHGRRRFSDRILAALGLERVIVERRGAA